MKRIRVEAGSTRQARQGFHKCARIGDIIKLEAVRFQSMYTSKDSGDTFPITHEVVRVTGTHGTVRLKGLCHGYGGGGPHGLRDLLMFCGLKQGHAELVAFNMPRRQVLGVDWTLELNTMDGLNRPGYVVLTPAVGEKRGWQRGEALMEVQPYKLIAWE